MRKILSLFIFVSFFAKAVSWDQQLSILSNPSEHLSTPSSCEKNNNYSNSCAQIESGLEAEVADLTEYLFVYSYATKIYQPAFLTKDAGVVAQHIQQDIGYIPSGYYDEENKDARYKMMINSGLTYNTGYVPRISDYIIKNCKNRFELNHPKALKCNFSGSQYGVASHPDGINLAELARALYVKSFFHGIELTANEDRILAEYLNYMHSKAGRYGTMAAFQSPVDYLIAGYGESYQKYLESGKCNIHHYMASGQITHLGIDSDPIFNILTLGVGSLVKMSLSSLRSLATKSGLKISASMGRQQIIKLIAIQKKNLVRLNNNFIIRKHYVLNNLNDNYLVWAQKFKASSKLRYSVDDINIQSYFKDVNIKVFENSTRYQSSFTKPIFYDKDGVRFVVKDVENSFGYEEYAADLVDKALNLNIVPKTELVEIAGKKYSAQVFVPDVTMINLKLKSGDVIEKPATALLEKVPEKVQLFDFLIGNVDRVARGHGHNILASNLGKKGRTYSESLVLKETAETKIHAIDNGLGFRPRTSREIARPVSNLSEYTFDDVSLKKMLKNNPSFVNALKKWGKQEIYTDLLPYIKKQNLDFLLERRAHLLSLVD